MFAVNLRYLLNDCGTGNYLSYASIAHVLTAISGAVIGALQS
jgi:hypothetical protein